MAETTDALRANSDALLRDLDVLGSLEDEKRAMPPEDPRMLELAGRIEEIAQRVLAGAAHERELAEEIVGGAARGVTARPIEETPRSIQAILADWRAAERRLTEAERGSAEALEAEAMVDAAREAYRRAYEAANREQPGE